MCLYTDSFSISNFRKLIGGGGLHNYYALCCSDHSDFVKLTLNFRRYSLLILSGNIFNSNGVNISRTEFCLIISTTPNNSMVYFIVPIQILTHWRFSRRTKSLSLLGISSEMGTLIHPKITKYSLVEDTPQFQTKYHLLPAPLIYLK